MNEELEARVDMSHEPKSPNGKPPADLDFHFFIYGGRERDYNPIDLGPKAPTGVPDCTNVPEPRRWNTACRDEAGVLVDPLDNHPSSDVPHSP
jgi:hypothetical protein